MDSEINDPANAKTVASSGIGKRKRASFDETLQRLVANGKWRTVAALRRRFNRQERSRYLWAWPTVCGLRKLGEELRSLGCAKVLSIGCGAGLLEWLLEQSSSIRVRGLDLDQSWWTSVYSPNVELVPRTFITADCPLTPHLLRMAAGYARSSRDYALMFCYFNNRRAFDAYIRAYGGDTVIVIGPLADDGDVHTDPRPLALKFATIGRWRMRARVQLDDVNENVAVIYVRDDVLQSPTNMYQKL